MKGIEEQHQPKKRKELIIMYYKIVLFVVVAVAVSPLENYVYPSGQIYKLFNLC